MFVYTEFYYKNSQYSLVTLCPGQTIKKCLLSLSLETLLAEQLLMLHPPPPGGGGDSGRGEGLSIIHSLPFPPTSLWWLVKASWPLFPCAQHSSSPSAACYTTLLVKYCFPSDRIFHFCKTCCKNLITVQYIYVYFFSRK